MSDNLSKDIKKAIHNRKTKKKEPKKPNFQDPTTIMHYIGSHTILSIEQNKNNKK